MSTRGLSREESIERIRHRTDPWDIVIIGGGATGIGVALDAASRGLKYGANRTIGLRKGNL